MGIELSLIAALSVLCKKVHLVKNPSYTIIECNTIVYVHLVPLINHFRSQELIQLQDQYKKEEKFLVHLWEDVWLLNQTVVLSRLKSFLGLNKTLHARKAVLIEIEDKQAVHFFNDYHLQGFVKAKYHFGLMIGGELISMASFSDLRPMKLKGSHYTSAELVRFASKDGYTITGGLSKLIKHFLKLKRPNDLMSYADRDWSLGKGYNQLGFELSAITEPAYLYVDTQTGARCFLHRLPKKLLSAFDMQKELNLDEYLTKYGYVKAFNTGNLKYHLYV